MNIVLLPYPGSDNYVLGFTGKELDDAIIRVILNQNQDGSWNEEILFVAPAKCKEKGNCGYFSSEELTTAISLEAIAKYRKVKQ